MRPRSCAPAAPRPRQPTATAPKRARPDEAPAALARGGSGGGAAKTRKKEPTADQKLLDAVAAEFRSGDAAALAARIPDDDHSKVALRLNKKYDGSYAHANAKGALESWFDDRKIVSVKRTSNDGLVGQFDVTLRRNGLDKQHTRTLTIQLRKERLKGGGERVTLVKLEVRGG